MKKFWLIVALFAAFGIGFFAADLKSDKVLKTAHGQEKASLDANYNPSKLEWLEVILNSTWACLPANSNQNVYSIFDAESGTNTITLFVAYNDKTTLDEAKTEVEAAKKLFAEVQKAYDWAKDAKLKVKWEKE
jgi:hypothetical protein